MKTFYIKILVLSGLLSLACTTKVSEWVLLNTIPGQYTLVYFHNNSLSEKIKLQNTALAQEMSKANILLKDAIKEDAAKPYYALYYGNRLFSRYDNAAELSGLISSPLRDKIAMEIKGGKLCVMLYLKTGTREKDEEGLQELRKAIESSPFGSIIPVVELNRNDAAEKQFISMLLNVESDLKGIDQPMLFGIFGRFKALEPLVSSGIKVENINLMIDFLTADCSCLIKDNLPGTDILYINQWDSPATALVNEILDKNPLLQH